MRENAALKKLLFLLYVLAHRIDIYEMIPVAADADKLWDYLLLNEAPPDKPVDIVAFKEEALSSIIICITSETLYCHREYEFASGPSLAELLSLFTGG